MRAAVFLNGSPDPPELLRRVAGRADCVIAADGGALHALDAGIRLDLVVGDMDSLGEGALGRIRAQGALLERHPVRKDEMDGQLAVAAAAERGATDIDLVCATGGRTDALFAVPHLLLAAERAGMRATVLARWGEMFVVEDGSRTVEGEAGESVSVFPVAGTARDVDLEGLEYPLKAAVLGAGNTLGFHNEISDGRARVSVGAGVLLVIREAEPTNGQGITEG